MENFVVCFAMQSFCPSFITCCIPSFMYDIEIIVGTHYVHVNIAVHPSPDRFVRFV